MLILVQQLLLLQRHGALPLLQCKVHCPKGGTAFRYNGLLCFPARVLSVVCCIFICRACFDELQMRNVLVWLVLDYVCDGVYILDIAVRLHTGTERTRNWTIYTKMLDEKPLPGLLF